MELNLHYTLKINRRKKLLPYLISMKHQHYKKRTRLAASDAETIAYVLPKIVFIDSFIPKCPNA